MRKMGQVLVVAAVGFCYAVTPPLVSTASEPAKSVVSAGKSASAHALVSPRSYDIGDCPIRFAPHSAVVGLIPTVVNLGVSGGGFCSLNFEIKLNHFNIDVDSHAQSAVFDPDYLTNRDTAPVSVDARMNEGESQYRQVIFPYGFHLKRATLWSALKFPVNTIKGKSFRVSATLVLANWDLGRYEPYANRKVLFQYPTKRAGYVNTLTLRTDSRGRVAQDGYRFREWPMDLGLPRQYDRRSVSDLRQ